MFAECTRNAILETIKIFQENGEVVCCIGSSHELGNMPIFAQADVAIAVDPTAPAVIASPIATAINATESTRSEAMRLAEELGFHARLVCLPCPLRLSERSRLGHIWDLILVSRMHRRSAAQAAHYFAHVAVVLACTGLFTDIAGLPVWLSLLDLAIVVIVVAPLVALLVLIQPAPPRAEIVRNMSAKNDSDFPDRWRVAMYTALRSVPVAAVLAFLVSAYDDAASGAEAEFAADAAMSLTVHFYLVALGLGHLHRTNSLREFHPSLLQVLLAALLLLISASVAAVRLAVVDATLSPAIHVPIIAVVFLFAIPLIDEFVKNMDRPRYRRYQKMLRLHFNTKLGMHSPI